MENPDLTKQTQSGSATPDGDIVVSVRGLTKVFKDFWGRPKARAVDNVDFEVRRGEVFGLLGPNGSGKTTIIKMLLGLLHPTKGHIEVFGRSPRHVETKSRIGYLPEESYLYRYLDSRETLDFFGNLFRLPAAERQRRIEQLLEMVGLSQTRTRPVGEFSKGMQRRIGLAQALINDPDLILLDEPTSGLDPIGCREMKDLIRTLASRGKTVILSSHLLADVEDVCDRVLILYGGRVQAIGTLQELLTRPDRIRITMPVLPRESLERILSAVTQLVPAGEVKLDNPTQNLESFFLSVVERARAAAAETSGVTSGHRIAEYLRAEVEAKPIADKILERLALPQTQQTPPIPVAPTQAPETVAEQKLEAYTKTAEPAQPQTQPAPQPQKEQVDLAKADEKLAGLLGKQK